MIFPLKNEEQNSAYYCDVLRRLRENVRRFRPELWRQKKRLLHHDNAPSHTSHHGIAYKKQLDCRPPTHPTLLTWPFATFFFLIEDKSKRLTF
jgi:hypothetical protein